MANGSKRLFFVPLFNKTDDRDDDMLKIRATSKPKAEQIAIQYIKDHGDRFTIGKVVTRKHLKKTQPEWHNFLWGRKAIEG